MKVTVKTQADFDKLHALCAWYNAKPEELNLSDRFFESVIDAKMDAITFEEEGFACVAVDINEDRLVATIINDETNEETTVDITIESL